MTPIVRPTAKVGPYALEIRGVSHRFGQILALDKVSLSVPRGAFVVLLGPNGAGKSTLFALATRLYDNTSGEIKILGHDVRRRPMAALQNLGVVFQSRSLDNDLSLKQNLVYHAALHGIGGKRAAALATRALTKVGLAQRAHDKVRALSGGQARRVEIARALLHQPSCLLLDEATAGLDVASRESVLKMVRGLVSEEAVGVLWATHLVDEVAEEDAIVLIHKGRVLFSGRGPALLEQAQTDNLRSAFLHLVGLS